LEVCKDGSIMATIMAIHIPRKDAAAPGHVCPGSASMSSRPRRPASAQCTPFCAFQSELRRTEYDNIYVATYDNARDFTPVSVLPCLPNAGRLAAKMKVFSVLAIRAPIV
jgi:hypothetical protein